MKIKNKLLNIFKSDKEKNRVPQKIAAKYTGNPDFPFLVSFPRTGSHWLRMMMELYFDKPSLLLLFNKRYDEVNDYTCYHTHDMELEVEQKNVLYLYRDPVETIYSQLNFHKEATTDTTRILHWTTIYGNHLDKWLYKENFTTQKTILTYQGLKNDLPAEFKKVCDFFEEVFDEAKIKAIAVQVSKDKIKSKTKHDPRVINTKHDYVDQRRVFKKNTTDLIYKKLEEINPNIPSLFR